MFNKITAEDAKIYHNVMEQKKKKAQSKFFKQLDREIKHKAKRGETKIIISPDDKYIDYLFVFIDVVREYEDRGFKITKRHEGTLDAYLVIRWMEEN